MPAQLVCLPDDLRQTDGDDIELIIYNRRVGPPPRLAGYRPVHVVWAADAPLVWV